MTFLNKTLNFLAGIGMLVMVFTLSSCNDDDGGLSIADQFEFETQKIDAYIAENGLNTSTDPNSGMRYRVTSLGNGLAAAFVLNLNAKVVDSVTVSYTAKLLDTEATVLTVSNQKIAYEEFRVGVRLALQYVQEGGTIQFFVPSAYGYGETGFGDIPANATLIYDLQLHEVHADRLRQDISEIEDYLTENEFGAIAHPTGFFYEIIEPGTGPIPTLFDIVVVNYDGFRLSDDFNFDGNTNIGFGLDEVITGWQIGLQQIRAGGTIKLYIPSRMAYGSVGSPPDIPANEQLIFEIDLLAVQN